MTSSSAPRRLTVLYADNSYTFGGAINALGHLLPALGDVNAVVLSAQPEEELRRLLPGVACQHWPVRLGWVHDAIHRRVLGWPGFQAGPLRAAWSKARAFAWLFAIDLPEAARIARFARTHRVQLVHLNNGVEGMVPVLLAARLLRLPLVAHARGPVTTSGIARAYARMVDRWIAVSGEIARNLRAAGVPEPRITVVHDAIDVAHFAPGSAPAGLRASLGIPAGAPVFGVFARIVDWKGIREFVLAARRVMDGVPDAYALVVGDASDGSEEYYEQVVRLAAELGIADRVVFTGFRQDVADLMRLCDVAVHSSIVPEPFGMTVIEAMATGTPVVAANAGGPTEIIPSEEYGLLVDPTDSAALAECIAGLLRDPIRAARIGAAGARRVREHYSAERYAHDVSAVYEVVRAAPDPGGAGQPAQELAASMRSR